MKRQRRKTDNCLNCGLKLDPTFDYCPSCGQENNDTQISFGKLLSDFFANYFSLDSRFGRSIKPFFIRPGSLTSEFMAGKRTKYANPIRLYLVVSLIHFFIFNLSIGDTPGSDKRIFESTSKKNEADSINATFDSLGIDDDLSEQLAQIDTSKSSNNLILSEPDWKIIKKLTDSKGPNYSVEQIEDSIRNQDKSYFAAKVNRQIIKLMKSDQQSISAQVVKNIPVLMFFLLPIYALLLKLFFRKKLYINHLIHGLHIHSFVFIVLTFYWLVYLFSHTLADRLEPLFFLVNTVYIVLSFKNAYSTGVWSAILRVVATGFIYAIVLTIGFMLEAIVSLLLF